MSLTEDMRSTFAIALRSGEILAKAEKNRRVGCFICQQIFPASEVALTAYLKDNDAEVLCPRCNMSSLIVDTPDVPLTKDLLKSMLSAFRASTYPAESKHQALFYDLQSRHFVAIRNEDTEDALDEITPVLLPPERVHVCHPGDLDERYDELIAKVNAGDRVFIGQGDCYEAALLSMKEFALLECVLRIRYYDSEMSAEMADGHIEDTLLS